MDENEILKNVKNNNRLSLKKIYFVLLIFSIPFLFLNNFIILFYLIFSFFFIIYIKDKKLLKYKEFTLKNICSNYNGKEIDYLLISIFAFTITYLYSLSFHFKVRDFIINDLFSFGLIYLGDTAKESTELFISKLCLIILSFCFGFYLHKKDKRIIEKEIELYKNNTIIPA